MPAGLVYDGLHAAFGNGGSSEMGDTAPQRTGFEEVTALREENVKHFSLGDGAYQAVVYGHPVHYQDENRAWQDIDNRLTLQTVKSERSTP